MDEHEARTIAAQVRQAATLLEQDLAHKFGRASLNPHVQRLRVIADRVAGRAEHEGE